MISKKYLSCIFEDKGKLFYIVYGQSGVQIYRDRCTLGLFYLLLAPYPEGGIEVNRTPKWITQYLANISPYALCLMPYALCLILPVAIIPFFFLFYWVKQFLLAVAYPAFSRNQSLSYIETLYQSSFKPK